MPEFTVKNIGEIDRYRRTAISTILPTTVVKTGEQKIVF
jgi:hypothetical protein